MGQWMEWSTRVWSTFKVFGNERSDCGIGLGSSSIVPEFCMDCVVEIYATIAQR